LEPVVHSQHDDEDRPQQHRDTEQRNQRHQTPWSYAPRVHLYQRDETHHHRQPHCENIKNIRRSAEFALRAVECVRGAVIKGFVVAQIVPVDCNIGDHEGAYEREHYAVDDLDGLGVRADQELEVGCQGEKNSTKKKDIAESREDLHGDAALVALHVGD